MFARGAKAIGRVCLCSQAFTVKIMIMVFGCYVLLAANTLRYYQYGFVNIYGFADLNGFANTYGALFPWISYFMKQSIHMYLYALHILNEEICIDYIIRIIHKTAHFLKMGVNIESRTYILIIIFATPPYCPEIE